MKTTVSDKLTNRQLFELCKKEFTISKMRDADFYYVYHLFQNLCENNPDNIYIAFDKLDHHIINYCLNYNAPQS